MDWDRAPPNGFDETTLTLCWDGADKSGDQDEYSTLCWGGDKSVNQDEDGLVRLLREHAGDSLRHLHVRCDCLLPYLWQSRPASIVELKRSRFSTTFLRLRVLRADATCAALVLLTTW